MEDSADLPEVTRDTFHARVLESGRDVVLVVHDQGLASAQLAPYVKRVAGRLADLKIEVGRASRGRGALARGALTRAAARSRCGCTTWT